MQKLLWKLSSRNGLSVPTSSQKSYPTCCTSAHGTHKAVHTYIVLFIHIAMYRRMHDTTHLFKGPDSES
jgi:hypothetical protein